MFTGYAPQERHWFKATENLDANLHSLKSKLKQPAGGIINEIGSNQLFRLKIMGLVV